MSANLAAIDELVEEFLKMELISVPPYPGQLGYLGSTKVNDFRTPLMPIQANSNKNSNQSQRHQSQQQQQQQQTQSQLVQQQQQQQAAQQQQLLQQQAAQHQLQQQQQQRSHHTSSHHNHHHNSASGHHYHHHHHHHHHHQASSENQYPLEPATIALTASPHEDALQKLTQRLESELRIAKRQHLACTEVLLPADLLPRISSQMFELSEKEPCGIRGCTIYIEFEDEPDNTRRIATMKTDPNTVSTFELYLTLKQDRRGWTSILPQFLKNLARGSTIMISPEFVLTKNKLYHAYSD